MLPFVILMEILPSPSTMFSDFIVELKPTNKYKRHLSKIPLKNLLLFWSALVKLKYLLIYQWNTEIKRKTENPQESMQHKTQRAEGIHLNKGKQVSSQLIYLKNINILKNKTKQNTTTS